MSNFEIMQTKGEIPLNRFAHTLVSISDNFIILFGGTV